MQALLWDIGPIGAFVAPHDLSIVIWVPGSVCSWALFITFEASVQVALTNVNWDNIGFVKVYIRFCKNTRNECCVVKIRFFSCLWNSPVGSCAKHERLIHVEHINT